MLDLLPCARIIGEVLLKGRVGTILLRLLLLLLLGLGLGLLLLRLEKAMVEVGQHRVLREAICHLFTGDVVCGDRGSVRRGGSDVAHLARTPLSTTS